MLEKLHFLFDDPDFKCCFSRTMNAVTCFKSALQHKSGSIFGSLIAVTALWLPSCSSPGPSDYSSPPSQSNAMPWTSPGPSGDSQAFGEVSRAQAKPSDGLRSGSSAVSESEAFAKPVKERPGLATQWGESVKSPLGDTRFTRASTKPHGVDAIFYNDAEGLKAMGAKDMRVDGMQKAAGGILEWGVRGNFGLLPAYKSYGNYRRFVEGKAGGSYSIAVKNVCKSRIQVVISVDGLDVLDGKPAGTSRPGYVISPGETLEIKGFRTSYDAVAAFKFSSVSQSYANTRHGDTRNVGVIGLAAFLERGSDPWTYMPKEIQQRSTAQPFATER
jgi:hypothetical protein